MTTALANALDSSPFPDAQQLGYRPRDILLLGAGTAHLRLLGHLAKHPLVGATVTLIAPHAHPVIANCLPNVVAGLTALDDCRIALEPMVRRAGVRWLQRTVTALDAQANTVQLDDGSSVHYDLLSVDTGPHHNRATLESTLPGARKHALFALPAESFTALWPQVVEMGSQRALRIAVLGEGALAVSLVMAARHVLPTASVTLVAGLQEVGHYAPAPMRQRIVRALKKRQITVLQDTATALDGNAVMLGCGAALACDVPLYAGISQAASWVTDSGLAMDSHGGIAVDAHQRSTSHAQVWVINTEIGTAIGSGVESTLAAKVTATVAGQPPQAAPAPTPLSGLTTQSCGNRYAIGNWGPLTFEGRWVWWLAQQIDQRAIARYRS
jgi:NADH dehydrogenase FAD-containing subunit